MNVLMVPTYSPMPRWGGTQQFASEKGKRGHLVRLADSSSTQPLSVLYFG